MEMMESEVIVDGFIEQEVEVGPRSVDDIRQSVLARAEETQRQMHDLLGFQTDIVEQAQEWSKNLSYDGSTVIDAIAETDSAAGMHNLQTRVTTLDIGAIEMERDEGYWNRVKAHEDVHNTQNVAVTRGSVMYQGKDVLLALVEWHAITESGQPDSDLTPDYQEHRRIGNEVASIVGSSFLVECLQSGDLLRLQDKINEAYWRDQLKLKPNQEFARG